MATAFPPTDRGLAPRPALSPGRLAQLACLLEVTACKPGNVHRFRDRTDLHFVDFLLSAVVIAEPLDRAPDIGIGAAVLDAIQATRRVVTTNTNLGIVLLLAPLAAISQGVDLATGVEAVLESTTVEDAQAVYRAIRLAEPGGLGSVSDQDIAREPTTTLRVVMALAAERDLIARQYANGFQEVLVEALPALGASVSAGRPLETAIVSTHLDLLAHHPDSLIVRRAGLESALEVSRRAAAVLDADWPDREEALRQCAALDDWLREPGRGRNPGTTADLVTAALYAALRDGTIQWPRPPGSWDAVSIERPAT
jgi:triphosphoribosyl-dephospho-CoA synthase